MAETYPHVEILVAFGGVVAVEFSIDVRYGADGIITVKIGRHCGDRQVENRRGAHLRGNHRHNCPCVSKKRRGLEREREEVVCRVHYELSLLRRADRCETETGQQLCWWGKDCVCMCRLVVGAGSSGALTK